MLEVRAAKHSATFPTVNRYGQPLHDIVTLNSLKK